MDESDLYESSPAFVPCACLGLISTRQNKIG